jgi:exodeoxyribonuclease V alpha subunit
VTVHKSQGSEFPAVIMPVLTQHYIMLQRNLVYTGMTRAKQLLVMVGTRKALDIAIGNNRPMQRNTLLSLRISGAPLTAPEIDSDTDGDSDIYDDADAAPDDPW